MDTLSYKTVSVNKEKAEKKWYVVDATDKHVGRLASTVAKVIRGKYKPSYTPHADCGDNIIIINAEKISFSGNKSADKIYTRYTGYPGGQRFTSVDELLKKHPERILEKAIWGMLPKGVLGRNYYRRCYVYSGETVLENKNTPLDLKNSDKWIKVEV